MMKRNFFIIIFILVLLIAILNELANTFFLYWRFWWFDILMHFLGGLWIGLSTLWVYYFSKEKEAKNKSFLFALFISFIATMFISLDWEIFEFFIKINMSSGYIYDTALDIFMSIVGSFVATVLFFNFYKNYQNNK